MKKIILLLISIFLTSNLYAWNHSIELGYGNSQDPNDTKYNNSGFFLSSDLFALGRTPLMFWSINGALGQWHSTAPVNKNVTSAALSLALRLYPVTLHNATPYLLASAGPAYISQPRFGTNTQASHATIQTTLGVGNEWKKYDMNFRLVHFSNANLGHINEGFNILYTLSVGYLF